MKDCDRNVTKRVLENQMDRLDSDSAAPRKKPAAADQRNTEEMKLRKKLRTAM